MIWLPEPARSRGTREYQIRLLLVSECNVRDDIGKRLRVFETVAVDLLAGRLLSRSLSFSLYVRVPRCKCRGRTVLLDSNKVYF